MEVPADQAGGEPTGSMPWSGGPPGDPGPGQPPPGHQGQTPYGQPPYGQDPYGQTPYGQPPYGHAPYGQGPYGQPPYGQAPYGQAPYGQAPYGQTPYGQPPYGQPPYGQAPYGQAPYGQGPYTQYGPYGWQYPPPAPRRPRLTPEQRRRRVRFGLVFTGVVILAIGAGIGIGAAIAPTSPVTTARTLFKTAVAAGQSAGSFHYAELSTNDGAPDDIVGDATPTGGRQVITERCATGINRFDLRLVKGVVYFRGNAAAVVDQLRVPPGHAVADASRWVKVTKGEGPYHTFAVGITAKSNLSQLPRTFVARTSADVPGSSPATVRIKGGLPAGKKRVPFGTAALVITKSNSLPKTFSAVAANSTSGARLDLSWTFSHWHQKLKVGAPATSVTYGSLGGHGTPASCG